MDERRAENVTDMAQRARRAAGEAQEMGARVGAHVQERAQELGGRAQEMASRAGSYVQEGAAAADERIERITGQPVEAWTDDARRWIESHPLQAVAITVGVGFLLGKLMTRSS